MTQTKTLNIVGSGIWNLYWDAVYTGEKVYPWARKQGRTLGIATETDVAQHTTKFVPPRPVNTQQEIDAPKPFTRPPVYAAGFSSVEDITGDTYVPGQGILYANTQAGEYTPAGEVATQWFSWSSEADGPTSVTWKFTFSGQSGSGGASLRVYSDTGDVMPTAANLVSENNVNAASGTVSVTHDPALNTLYYLQRGIQEKAGTVGPLITTWVWGEPLAEGSATFYYPSPVIP